MFTRFLIRSFMEKLKSNIVKIFFLWENLGPYHLARMEALRACPEIDLNVVELYGEDKKYPHAPGETPKFKHTRLRSGPQKLFSGFFIGARLISMFKKSECTVVVIPGYNNLAFISALLAAKWSKKKAVLSVATHEMDKTRIPIKEAIKKFLLKFYDGFLSTGILSETYLKKLGVPESKIFKIGNVVDNHFFERITKMVKHKSGEIRSELDLPESYFLYVGRFSREKNLVKLLEAYGLSRTLSEKPWSLVLVGSGPEEKSLREFVERKELLGVKFYPFQPLPELVSFYALAKTFILPSKSEPWGLVVNEAMACSLPILVSDRAGCIPELLQEGENGFSFHPMDLNKMAELMSGFSEGEWDLARFGSASHAIIQDYGLDTYSEKIIHALTQIAKD